MQKKTLTGKLESDIYCNFTLSIFSWNNTDSNTLTKQIITYDKFTSVDLKNHRYPSGNFLSFAGKSHE